MWPAIGWLISKTVGTRLAGRRYLATAHHAVIHRRAAVIAPGFNEDLGTWEAMLRSILDQTHRPCVVVAIDDGSTEGDLAAAAEGLRPSFEERSVPLQVIHFPQNRGKREALAAGVRACKGHGADVYVTVDSDTILELDCIHQLLLPFAVDARVTAATAVVGAANRRGLLARMLDVRYTSAFLVDRGWQSTWKAMLCCCGSAAAYRADVIHRHLDTFVGQHFLGRRCVAGDDRRLTALALLQGRTVVAPGARAQTYVPERLGHWLRQQVRWNRSWIRETWLLLVEQPLNRPAWWLALVEASTWFSFTILLGFSLARFVMADPSLFGWYAAVVVVASLARGVPYLDRFELPWRTRLAGLAVAPLYGLVHLATSIPLRLWAACTLTEARWGTRQQVEVTA